MENITENIYDEISDEITEETAVPEYNNYPMIVLRGIVVFPYGEVSMDIGREKSLKALAALVEEKKSSEIFFATQFDTAIQDPNTDQIMHTGVICTVKQIVKISKDIVKVVVAGKKKAVIRSFMQEAPYFRVEVEEISEEFNPDALSYECEALMRKIKNQCLEFARIEPKTVNANFREMEVTANPYKLLYGTANQFLKTVEERIEILETPKLEDALLKLCVSLVKGVEILKLDKKINLKVKKSVDKNQKEYYLREQIKAIQEELGDTASETKMYEEKLENLKLKNKDTVEKVKKDIRRLSTMNPQSPDFNVMKNYLDFFFDLPWEKFTKDNTNIANARVILDEDHFGLEKVKERILEFLAVHALTKTLNGPILCFVGPPGVGKTSIAKSIARALDRKFVRMSLGGVRDEAEIRGHRKTYIGAMSGKILYNIRNAKSANPVFLLDEIEKMTSDMRGDPQSAMLEVLDPEMNKSFKDNFLEVDFDLSKTLFVATANSLDNISAPLLDRMEVIQLSGYTEEEKIEIAKRYLIPRKLKENGVDDMQINITDKALSTIIYHYTRESGVRSLEREIGKISRRIALKYASGEIENKVDIDVADIESYLGTIKYLSDTVNVKNEIGTCNGLAWTSVGGTTLEIEVSLMPGKGEIILTGKLGDVMKESARTALSYIHAHAYEFGISESLFNEKDIHLHVPEGATPKDGPSAGITIATAILSAMTKRPTYHDVAMTGEITLRGKVLPIGGLKEKVLAASRHGIKKVLIPFENAKDIAEIPASVREKIEFVTCKDVNEVFAHAILKEEHDN
ncbi:MAG: endopeptidase La [Bacillota bacterium]